MVSETDSGMGGGFFSGVTLPLLLEVSAVLSLWSDALLLTSLFLAAISVACTAILFPMKSLATGMYLCLHWAQSIEKLSLTQPFSQDLFKASNYH